MFEGAGTALVTPFTKDGIDFESLEKLINFQVDNGIDNILVLGTTGEPSTMTLSEKLEVIKFTVEKVNHRAKVIVGVGCNCTQSTIDMCKQISSLDVDGLLIVTPYYNKANQDGVFQHYSAVAKSTTLPIIAYNVPYRTGVNMLPETFRRIVDKHSNVVAVKEASGNMQQIMEYIDILKGTNAIVLSGDDALTVPTVALGGKGIISVAANIIPKEVSKMTSIALSGDIGKASQIQLQLLSLMKELFCDVNPIPIKKATELMGLTNGILRLPLTKLDASKTKKLTNKLKEYSLC